MWEFEVLSGKLDKDKDDKVNMTKHLRHHSFQPGIA